MKKVIITVTNDLEMDQRMHKTALVLCANGYDVMMFGRMTSDSKALERSYKTHRILMLFQSGPLFYVWYNIRLFFYLLFHAWDVVLSCDLDTLLAASMARRWKNKQLVYDSHELFSEVPEVQQRPKVQRFWQKLERRLLPKLQYAYTVSQSIADYYEKMHGVKMQVVRNVPMRQIEEKQIQLPCEPGFILYQGTLNVGRGLEKMIDAMEFLPDNHLVIAGDGPLFEELKQRAANNKRIHFTGRLAFDELKYLTRQAALGLSLEENLGLNYQFALPNKVFDYFQAEIPVVLSDLPELHSLVNESGAGILVPSDCSAKFLAQKISLLLEDKALYAEQKKAAQKAALTYHWEEESKRQLEIFRSVTELSKVNG